MCAVWYTGNTTTTRATRRTYYINPIDIRAVRRQHPAVEPRRRPDGGRPFCRGNVLMHYYCVHAHNDTRRGIFTFLFSLLLHHPPPSHTPVTRHRAAVRDDMGARVLNILFCIGVQYSRVPSGLSPDFWYVNRLPRTGPHRKVEPRVFCIEPMRTFSADAANTVYYLRKTRFHVRAYRCPYIVI